MSGLLKFTGPCLLAWVAVVVWLTGEIRTESCIIDASKGKEKQK